MNRIVILLLLIFTVGATEVNAQSRKEKKMQETINKLMEQPFIKVYKDEKRKVERIAYEFKAREHEFPKAEVDIIRYNYRLACQEFDAILISIRNKMLNKRERNLIMTEAGCQEYARKISNDLKLAMADYDQNVVQRINELTGEKVHGFGITDIKLLVDLMVDVWETIQGIDHELDKMTEDYMNEKFTKVLLVSDYESLGQANDSRSLR